MRVIPTFSLFAANSRDDTRVTKIIKKSVTIHFSNVHHQQECLSVEKPPPTCRSEVKHLKVDIEMNLALDDLDLVYDPDLINSFDN